MIGGVTQTDNNTIDEQIDGKLLILTCAIMIPLNIGIHESDSESITQDNNTDSGKYII